MTTPRVSRHVQTRVTFPPISARCYSTHPVHASGSRPGAHLATRNLYTPESSFAHISLSSTIILTQELNNRRSHSTSPTSQMLTAKRLPSGKPPRKRLACPSCALLTLVISLAIIVASLAILLLYDVATPPLSNTFLSQRDFPQGQRLRQKTRRVTKLGASCDGFGVQRELFFHKFGGVHCALVAWESADEYEEEDRYIARLETVYKVFASNVSADEYFTKFWGTHLYDHLPPYLYVDQSDSSPLVGQQTRAFRWDSSNVRPGMPVPLQAASTPPHIIFLFRCAA